MSGPAGQRVEAFCPKGKKQRLKYNYITIAGVQHLKLKYQNKEIHFLRKNMDVEATLR